MQMVRILLSRAIGNFKSRPGLNVTSAAVIAVGLILLSSFWLVLSNLQQVTRGWIEQVDVVCFLSEEATPEAALMLHDEVSGWPEVQSVGYVTREQALEDLRGRLGEYGSFLDDLEGNPLTDLLEIETGRLDPGQWSALEERLQSKPVVDEVYSGRDWVERLQRMLAWMTAAGTVVGLFLVLAVVLIGGNTIKLTLHARRDEIQIALLVGATQSFVLIPFYIEGALLGLCGGLVAAVFMLPFSQWAAAILLSQPGFWLSGIELRPLGWAGAGLLLVTGVALGLFGSLISLIGKDRVQR